ncbi:kinesin family member 20B S homeolog isoform X2 [Xenopus laevis]|uniref:Kinesin family member 20B S homeolog isoform X2 n=2 Tax=Xenopus laevis TaxID=8355 RepID=A0A1L8FEU9_XENLA|nr:kinesin family member 20B S homeolog isoform X2 [Xenopus laevis]OCT70105.1 hypothetical protein XELAEV_18037026mg [Xenopus laevis]
MKPAEVKYPPPRPSYLGVAITYPERDEPQPIDDLRTNLADKFLSLGRSESESTQKDSLGSQDHMQVYLRVRPFTAGETEQKEAQDCISIPDSSSVLVKPPHNSQACRLSEKANGSVAQKFTFTHVFGPDTTQAQFFDGTIKQHVIDFIKGQNRLIFTYGVTNAGKTFTFQGTKDNEGILPRSMDMLFNSIQGRVYNKMDVKPHRCKDYVRLTKEQVKAEVALKNSVLRQIKEVDCSIRSNNSRNCQDTTDFINDEGLTNSSSILSDMDDHLRHSEESKLALDGSAKFSVWVSFCEIYNECIYDLLDPISGDKFYKRKTLRLALDLKGYSFVKDLQWIEVSDSTEACKILALGKKFQSIAYTKLNSSSSRSHSIFTVRLLKIEDSDIPRVLKVSELALCDLAGSERCTKTQNEGERLKESGNINTSLLILGKCINALKTSQQSKAQQHVPFRESKLTHYLQSFFSGKGKVCMIVNICQSASSYDETLNVLKFSAVAQKVLILESCQNSEAVPCVQKKSAREVSFIINNADSKHWNSRKRATVQWDSRLEDVPEDGNDEEDSEEEECLDCTYQDDEEEEEDDGVQEDELVIKKDAYQKLLDLIEDLKTKLVNEKKDKLLMELKIREEVAKEFTDHFMQREKDFNERLEKEKELMEDRCDERIEIFQDLVRKCSKDPDEGEEAENRDRTTDQVEQTDAPIDGLYISMQNDLTAIKKQAMDAQVQIISIPDVPDIISKMEQKLKQISCDLSKTQEELKKKSSQLEFQNEKCSRATVQLEEADRKLSSHKQQIDQLVSMIEQKESAIDRLKDLVSHWEAKCEDYEKTVNGIKGEMIKVNNSAAGRKRPPEDHQDPVEQPPSKKEFAEVIDTHNPTAVKQTHVNNGSKEPAIHQEVEGLRAEMENYKTQIHNFNHAVSLLEEKLARSDEQVTEMKSKNHSLISELQASKDHTISLEGTVKVLMQEVDENKLNSANKVAQIRTLQNKLDEIGKRANNQGNADISDLHDLDEDCNQRNIQNESNPAKVGSNRESTFYSAIDGLWKKCQEVLQESTKKTQLIQELEQKLETLNNDINTIKNEREDLQTKLNAQISNLNEKEDLIAHLRSLLSERADLLENQKNQEAESEKAIQELKTQVNGNKQQIKELQCLLDSYKEKCERLKCLEEQNKAKASDTLQLEQHLEEAQAKYKAYEKDITTLHEEKKQLEKNTTELQEKLNAAEKANGDKEEQVGQSEKEVEMLKKDLSQRASELKVLKLDLQRKEEDCTELKDKLMDSKKQIQQVEKEVSGMREEKRLLTNKVSEYEKLKNQMSRELEMKQRTIQQLKKEPADNEKNGDVMSLYQKACQEAQEKEKIIEDMRATLIEQEQTQVEQDQVLEAKEKESEKLSQDLEEWKRKCKELENNLCKGQVIADEMNNAERNKGHLSKLKDQLKEFEEKYNTERKKWLEEKMNLLAQAKESETHRNKEMRKFAEDRERYAKHQAEMEHLVEQLAEKDNTLQKWREERDQLLSALEIQLKNLLSSNMEKDKEIENLKNSSTSRTQEEASDVAELKRLLALREDAIKELQQNLANLERSKTLPANETVTNQGTEEQKESIDKPEQVNQQLNNTKISVDSTSSADDCQSQGGSDTVLDSSAISTEFGRVSRFPRPEMEINFSPMRPNKMEVKHRGENSPRTVKISRTARKRKSEETEQEAVKSENKKNTTARTGVKTPSSQSSIATDKSETKKIQRSTVRKQPSVSSTASTISSRKKDGTLQKLGDFLQSSPSIFQTKAKKFLETIAAPKALDVGISRTETENKPKKSRRKLYTTDISVPLDIPANSIVLDTKEKESDHLIMKRRLRTRTAK